MNNYLLGTAVALSALVGSAAAEDAKGSGAKSLDGAWTVVCFEKNGQPQADAKGMTVKADAGTITCSGRDGKPALTLKVAFGPNGTVQVTEGAGDTSTPGAARSGVYVLTQGYLAISVNDDAVVAGADPKAAADGQPAKSRCSVILRREGVPPGGEK
ncbi:MAG: hypothetical protein JWO38_816 [Gemmataceae bacterium]|nr:hypothetical protein [Gemmataceae bacterium]